MVAGRHVGSWVDKCPPRDIGASCPVANMVRLAGEEDLLDDECVVYSGIRSITLTDAAERKTQYSQSQIPRAQIPILPITLPTPTNTSPRSQSNSSNHPR